MITVILRGGLGNQMFQYALGLRLAKKSGVELALDTVLLKDRLPRRNFTYRDYSLDIFSLAPRFTALSKAAEKGPLPGVWLGLDALGIMADAALGRKTFLKEKDGRFDARALEPRDGLVLFGWWQSERYFADAEDDVRAAFRLRRDLGGSAMALAEKISATRSVSLHVRRGDYLALADVMSPTGPDYYARAAAYIGARVERPEFFVFSDDLEWCRKNIKIDFPTTYVDIPEGPRASHHLRLMSLCEHNIIANSSFSWWGAWLNENKKKIVIAPARWYVDSTLGKDIVPENWTRI